jgi:hypothetical protein
MGSCIAAPPCLQPQMPSYIQDSQGVYHGAGSYAFPRVSTQYRQQAENFTSRNLRPIATARFRRSSLVLPTDNFDDFSALNEDYEDYDYDVAQMGEASNHSAHHDGKSLDGLAGIRVQGTNDFGCQTLIHQDNYEKLHPLTNLPYPNYHH